MLKIIAESLLIATRMHGAYAPHRDEDRPAREAAEAARPRLSLQRQPQAAW
ncbi:MAG: hypothetical protein N2Z62_16630 [Rhodobacteraceae bacterium]|nr:hypothetical protein [Paracoccaceae bacterium]